MSFGGTPTTTTGGFSFGAPAQSQPSTFGVTGGGDAGAKAAEIEGAKTFRFGAAPAGTTPQPSFSFGSQAAAVKPATTTSAPSEAEAPKPLFGASTATTSISSQPQTFSSQSTTAAAAPTSIATTTQKTPTATNLTTTTKTTESTIPTSGNQINFGQLEEHINKWTLELEEQEKVFTNQATQINAWDKLLISNNDKIVALNDAVQKVKTEQQTLEQELEFIATQHAELEESITPLQKDLHNIPQVDVERTQTYLLVENLDTQLKQMSEDLKEVIDYLNEANKAQDNTDPIVQIGKILNAHMSSLQWIESSSSAIGAKIDEISKMHESLRRDSERSFRLTYYD